MMKASSILASTARAASYNMLLQILIRLMTFVFNAVILRYISRDLLGVLNVRLTLLYSTILFLTKEAFERACLSRRDNLDWRYVINLMWCSFPLGVIISVLLSAVWMYILERPDPSVVAHYDVGVVAFAVSACLEVLAEPLYVTGQAFLFIKLKPFFDMHLVHLTWSFFRQSFLKQILTEGERYVMTFLNVLSFADQGVYDVINNLGSLVARFIFLPIEENGYLFFSQTLQRGKSATEQSEENISLCSRVLGVLLKIVTLIGCTVVVFGYANSYLALHIYGGERISAGSGPTLLRWYCVYVLLLAINGVTEGFVFATMSKEEVDKYNQKLLLFSVVFMTTSWLLTTQIGSVGFILANCLNMLFRSTHSVLFIRRYFERVRYRPLPECVPSIPVIVVLGLSLLVTAVSEGQLVTEEAVLAIGNLQHIIISGLCLLAVLAVILLTENNMVRVIRDQFMPKQHVQ